MSTGDDIEKMCEGYSDNYEKIYKFIVERGYKFKHFGVPNNIYLFLVELNLEIIFQKESSKCLELYGYINEIIASGIKMNTDQKTILFLSNIEIQNNEFINIIDKVIIHKEKIGHKFVLSRKHHGFDFLIIGNIIKYLEDI